MNDFTDISKKIIKSKNYSFPIDGKYLIENGMKEGLEIEIETIHNDIEKQRVLREEKISANGTYALLPSLLTLTHTLIASNRAMVSRSVYFNRLILIMWRSMRTTIAYKDQAKAGDVHVNALSRTRSSVNSLPKKYTCLLNYM